LRGSLAQLVVGGLDRAAGSGHMLLHLLIDALLDQVERLLHIIGERPDAQVIGRDTLMLNEQGVVEPLDERRPEVAAYQQDRNGALYLAGLDERQHLEQLVKRAKASGEEDVGLGGEIQHDLAAEEVVEADGAAHKGIDALLVWELDVDTNRVAASFVGSLV